MTATRPSDLTDIEDRWAALQFDNAIRFMGAVIENAAQETIEVGPPKHKKRVPKYHLEQLLDEDFRLPPPKAMKRRDEDGFAAFLALSKSSGNHTKVK